MGIVFKQSLQNTITTYLGFGIGAINTMFLYTHFMADEYYGLVGFILSTSAILSPLMALGVPNTMVRYYSSFTQKREQEGFSLLMLLLPLAAILPLGIITYLAYGAIAQFISGQNAMVKDYVWYIFWVALAMGYFEVFYAWARVQKKSVFGNFLKEVLVRALVMVLLILLHYKIIDVAFFMKALVASYIVRTIAMKLYAYVVKAPVLKWHLPLNTKEIVWYSLLMILGASASTMVLEVDRFMINQYVQIENIAYYSVAVFMASVIIVPSRAMHQITYPLTAELLNKDDHEGLEKLYQRSSLTLLILAGGVFALIMLCLQDLYAFIPESYHGGASVVLLIGLAKIYDSVLGNINSILYNSKYYISVLWFAVLLAVFTVLFNLWLIPRQGILGAAYASFLAIFIYNSIKLWFVWAKFRLQPFSWETLKTVGILLVLGGAFYILPIFPSSPLLALVGKGLLFGLAYGLLLYAFSISEDLSGLIRKYLKRKTP